MKSILLTIADLTYLLPPTRLHLMVLVVLFYSICFSQVRKTENNLQPFVTYTDLRAIENAPLLTNISINCDNFEYNSNNYDSIILSNQLEYVMELYKNKHHFKAITEAKRLQFFDKQKIFIFETNNLIAESYKNGGYMQNATLYYLKNLEYCKTQTDSFQNRIEIAKLYILQRKHTIVRRVLNDLALNNKSTTDYKETEKKINYWHGWNYIFEDKWDSASYFFNKTKDTLLSNYCTSIYKSLYSVNISLVLSYLIPGAGQIYNGFYFNGLLSFAWNLFAGYNTINAFNNNRPYDGIFSLYFLWLRFYFGNVNNSEFFAKENNRIISNDALEYLQNNYEGNKP